MQKTLSVRLCSIFLLLAVSATGAFAQSDSGSSTNLFSLDDNFRPGLREFTLGVGPMFSPIGSDMNRPVVNWVEGYAQLGYMMTKIRGTNFLDGALRGNLELSGELFGAGIYEETGHYIAGGTIWLGYNLVPQNSRWSAYARAGLGGEFMDINHMYDGHNFNFNVDAAAGLHYFIKPTVSLNAEFLYQHLSNADTADRNIGVNAMGPTVGISWFFP